MNELEKQIQDYINKRTRERINEHIQKGKEKMKVYVLTGSWATEDDCDSFVEIFSTYEKARKVFEACIADELESDWFKERDNMVIDNESKDFCCIYQEGDYLLNHSQFEIKEMEVQ